ncbi:MAG: quinone-dependent dihydroorotate dehydrogenase [Fimbriimonadaceae bacterium]|jgi:dihydroorotate dehydrogenase|nr:quinone-dependent dihydroorotate dehydrogenase [Fimbriimonadaceae bacterium]
MSLYESLLRPVLFGLDAETAHELGMKAIRSGLLSVPEVTHPSLERKLFGVSFRNPVGLAAGFDKNAVAVDHWHKLGFGFVEVGTITKHPQPGNPKPRLFRLPADKGLINRLGFNNEGAEAVASRLSKSSPQIPLGINLGKSKVTELAEAAEDYAYSFKLLRQFGAYFVVNVSSPNTPGLRALQEKGPLTQILWRLREIDGSAPLFVKIAPDLEPEALQEIVEVAVQFDLAGLIATNTTLSRERLTADPKQEGGLSGAPLRERADSVLKSLRALCPPEMTLIGVGGIVTQEDAKRKMDLGASLIQVYSGWVYNGPDFATKLCGGLIKP